MSNVTTLPVALKARAAKYVNDGLNENRGYAWAIDYHRKLRMMIVDERDRDEFYSEYEGEPLFTLKTGIEIETEQALRALIDHIHELEQN